MNYIGSALLGMSQGMKQEQQYEQDQDFQQKQRALLLQDYSLKNQETQLDIASKQAALNDQMYEAGLWKSVGSNGNPADVSSQQSSQGPTIQQLAQPQGPAQPAPTPTPQGNTMPVNYSIDPGIQNDRDKERLRILRQEQGQYTDPQDQAALGKEIQATQAKVDKYEQAQKYKDQGIATPQAAAVQNKREAGLDPTPDELGQAVKAQMGIADRLSQAANKAFADSHPLVGMKLMQQASDVRKKALDDLKENGDIRKRNNDEVKEVVAGLDPETVTQEGYTAALDQLRSNPVFQKQAKSLGLTGQLSEDRNKLAQLQHQTMTVTQIEDLKLKKQAAAEAAQRDADLHQQRELRIAEEKQDLNFLNNLQPHALETAAQRYRELGILPPLGQSKFGGQARAMIMNMASRLDDADGISSELAAKHQILGKAEGAALQQLERNRVTVETFEQTAENNLELAKKASDDVSRTTFKTLNEAIQKGKTEFNDPDMAKLHAATETFVTEYAKVMSGGGPGSVTSDSSREHARSLLSTAMDKKTYDAVLDQLKLEMGGRIKSFDQERQRILGDLSPTKKDQPAGKVLKFDPTTGSFK